MIQRATLIAIAALGLSACGGSIGTNSLPEISVPTANAAALASAFSRAKATDGTVAFQAYRRQNAFVARWAADADACITDYTYIVPGRVTQGFENRVCQFGTGEDELLRQDIDGGMAFAFTATCPQVGAEAGPDGNVPTEFVAFQISVTDDLSTANLVLDEGEVETLTDCELLLAPVEEETEEEE